MEYRFFDEADKIAEQAIANWHPHLLNNKVRIAHIAKVKPSATVSPVTGILSVGRKKRGRPSLQRAGKKITMAKTSKVSPKTLALAMENYAFTIEYDTDIWATLNDAQKLALVDHELCHCGVDGDGYYLKHHDFEEFRQIVDRHGFWKDDIKAFAETTEGVYHEQQQAQVPEPEEPTI